MRALALALLFSCGGAATGSPPQGAGGGSDNTVCWPIAAMQLVSLDRAPTEGKPIAQMQGDGAMYSLRDGARSFVGRVSNDAMLDKYDTPSLTCVHREVGLPGSALQGHYEADDTYVDDRTRISVADNGTLTMSFDGREVPIHLRVEGPLPKIKRSAVLLVLAAQLTAVGH
jgi:hypothetical protein